jgi:hypothetical protein
MVEERLTDGVRVAQLLSSEVTGGTGPLAAATVVDADPDVTPTADGARAFSVSVADERVATAYVLPERVRLEVRRGVDAAADTAAAAGLRVRRHPGPPPRALVFVPDGAAVKRAADALAAALAVQSAGDGHAHASEDDSGPADRPDEEPADPT